MHEKLPVRETDLWQEGLVSRKRDASIMAQFSRFDYNLKNHAVVTKSLMFILSDPRLAI